MAVCHLCPELTFADDVGLSVHRRTNAAHKKRAAWELQEAQQIAKRTRLSAASHSTSSSSAHALDGPAALDAAQESDANGGLEALQQPKQGVDAEREDSQEESGGSRSFPTASLIQTARTGILRDSRSLAPPVAASGSKLSLADSVLLKIAPQLTSSSLDMLLRALQRPDFNAADTQWHDREEMLDDIGASEIWTEQTALTFEGQRLPFLLRQDRLRVLQELLRKVPAPRFRSEKLYSEAGSRLYDASRVHTGRWFSRMEERVLAEVDADGILPFFTYSDSSQVTLGGHEFHPIVLYLACGTVEDSRKDAAFRRIAFLLKPSYKTLGLDKTLKRDRDTHQWLRHKYINKVFEQTIEPFKAASHRAYDFEFWQDGELRTARLVPVPMQHCSDLMEAYLVGNLQGIRSQMPIVRTMVPRNALANIVEEFQPRTEAGMAQAVARARHYVQQGQSDRAIALLDSLSIFSTEQSGLAGFNHTSWPALFYPDALHIDKGMADHIVDRLRGQLRPKQQEQLDKACTNLPPFDDFQLPYQPMTSSGLHTADKARNFLKLLPALLLGIEELSRRRQWIELIAAFLEWQRHRDLLQHSDASLQELRDKRIDFQEKAVALWDRLGYSWEGTPKFFMLRQFEDSIPELGGAAISSTDFGERSHKTFKQQAQFTNHQSASMTIQMLQHDIFTEGCKRLLEGADSNTDPSGRQQQGSGAGALQQAARLQRPVPVQRSHRLHRDPASRSEGTTRWWEGRREIHNLFPVLDRMELDCTPTEAVSIVPGVAVPFQRHRGSAWSAMMLRAGAMPLIEGPLNAVRAQRQWPLHNAAVRGQGERADEEWVCQLLLFIRVQTTEGEGDFALIRWLDDVPTSAFNSLGRLTGMRCVRWASETRSRQPWYDLLPIGVLLRPVYLQPHPHFADQWFVNHFV